MHLGPHHFQVQNRYFEDSTHFVLTALSRLNYGVLTCQFNPEALANGTLSLVEARGVLPDGLTFSIPDCDAIPESRPIADFFPPVQDRLTVMLGIPPLRPGAANCELTEFNGNTSTRYLAKASAFRDETNGRDERQVQVGRKNLSVLFETEPHGTLVTLPVARITRSGAGGYVFDRDFIPPCLRSSASVRLTEIVGGLVEIMEDKARSLLGPARASARRALTSRDVAAFWFLHTLHESLPVLRHLYAQKNAHPVELFVELSRLGGGLCTFSLDSDPSQLPKYDHDALGDCFQALHRHIRRHLELILPTTSLAIPLAPEGDSLYAADVPDQRAFGKCQWVLGIRSRLGEAEIIRRAPKIVKLCSRLFVPELVKRALPGMELTYLPVPPAAVAPTPETKYFAVTRAGPCWDHIVQTRRVGAYVPAELPDVELELVVVLES